MPTSTDVQVISRTRESRVSLGPLSVRRTSHPTASVDRAPAPAPLEFRLLGDFSVQRGAWQAQPADWGRPAAARLVRYLVVNRDVPIHGDAICEALWPELDADGARRSLRVAASRARQALDCPGADVSVVEVVEGCYRLVLDDSDTVDAEEFEKAAIAASPGTERNREALERARALWCGEPLPVERYADWATAWRERLIERQIAVLASLTTHCTDAGDHAAAIEAGRELVCLDTLNEGAHRLLMTAYARAGRTGRALRQYLICRNSLVEELGIEPSRETSRLQARVLAGEAV
jgi:DNA-binding SARP family transcriptional activator